MRNAANEAVPYNDANVYDPAHDPIRIALKETEKKKKEQEQEAEIVITSVMSVNDNAAKKESAKTEPKKQDVKTEVRKPEEKKEDIKTEVKKSEDKKEDVKTEVKKPEEKNEDVKTEVKKPEEKKEDIKTEVKKPEDKKEDEKTEVKKPEDKKEDVKTEVKESEDNKKAEKLVDEKYKISLDKSIFEENIEDKNSNDIGMTEIGRSSNLIAEALSKPKQELIDDGTDTININTINNNINTISSTNNIIDLSDHEESINYYENAIFNDDFNENYNYDNNEINTGSVTKHNYDIALSMGPMSETEVLMGNQLLLNFDNSIDHQKTSERMMKNISTITQASNTFREISVSGLSEAKKKTAYIKAFDEQVKCRQDALKNKEIYDVPNVQLQELSVDALHTTAAGIIASRQLSAGLKSGKMTVAQLDKMDFKEQVRNVKNSEAFKSMLNSCKGNTQWEKTVKFAQRSASTKSDRLISEYTAESAKINEQKVNGALINGGNANVKTINKAGKKIINK